MNTLRRLFSDFDIIVDAMIGVGGSENLKGDVNDILNWVKDKDSLKCAIDVPTGLNSLTGKASDNCFEAAMTITMFAEKIGLLINQGADKSGFVNVADLGAPSSVLIDVAKIFKFNIEDIKLFLPKRKPNTSKFDYGRVLIVAGSAKYPGAAALTANAAISMGTGLVELFTEVIHPSLLPEIIVHSGQSDNYFENQFDEILHCVEKADSIVIGPGLGHENIGFAKKLIEAIPNDKKIIVDADAIAALDYNNCYNNNLIITPHLGEFTRLIDVDRNEIDDKTLDNCIEVAKNMNIIVHLKHYPSITSDGTISFLTTEGNPGMATAGSGDVLSGIIGALAGLGLNSLRAAAMGAYIHALAGDNYADEFDEYSLTASKIIERIPYVLSSSYNISDEDNYDEEDN
jgi:NAD(P)H-hydrate epimerase